MRSSTEKLEHQPTIASYAMTEINFDVSEDEVDRRCSASALGYGIHTQGESSEDIRQNVKEAVDCYFDKTMTRPELIRLHLVRDEVLKA